jgi:ubiquinone/menaquinone biosynthesis C-methylase UbiE
MLNSSSAAITKAISGKQEEVRKFWNKTPCGSDTSALSSNTQEYYYEIETKRYQYQYHIPSILGWVDWNEKQVLEVGSGVGTDARQIINKGGVYTGINIDAGSVASTSKALEAFGLQGNISQVNAVDMSFDDNTFDIVYSFGVLHHIPEVDDAIREISRVLKPGGELLIMLYNRNSINYKLEIRLLRKLALRILSLPGIITLFGWLGFPKEKLQKHAEIYRTYGKLNDQEWLSRNTDGPDNPYSEVYDEHEASDLLHGRFTILKNEVYYFESRHWGIFGSLLPRSLVDYLGRRWGWHRIIYARKLEPISKLPNNQNHV